MKELPKVNNVRNRLTTVLFIIYLAAVCWILLFKLGVQFSYMRKRSVNLIPFNEASRLNMENVLNVLIFVPLGIYTGILLKRWKFGNKILFCFSLSLLVETLQYIFSIGAFDVSDIITNSTGGIIGLLIFRGLDKAFNNSAKTHAFINIIAAAGTGLMILLLVLLKFSMLPVRYQ